MLLNLVIPLITDLFRNRSRINDGGESFESLKTVIRKELSAQLSKIFAGLILTALMIIALAKFATALSLYIEQFQNPLVLQMITFAVVLAIAGGLLYFVLKPEEVKQAIPAPETKNDFDISSLFHKFTAGVERGFERNRPLRPTDSSSI